MNKWQKVYCNKHYKGKVPTTKIGKEEFELLGSIKKTVTVELPSETKTFLVTETECNIPEGKISVSVLASNLRVWKLKGYKVTTK